MNLACPSRLVNELVYELVEAGILAELAADNPKERSYQPAVDINKITRGVYLQPDGDGGWRPYDCNRVR